MKQYLKYLDPIYGLGIIIYLIAWFFSNNSYMTFEPLYEIDLLFTPIVILVFKVGGVAIILGEAVLNGTVKQLIQKTKSNEIPMWFWISLIVAAILYLSAYVFNSLISFFLFMTLFVIGFIWLLTRQVGWRYWIAFLFVIAVILQDMGLFLYDFDDPVIVIGPYLVFAVVLLITFTQALITRFKHHEKSPHWNFLFVAIFVLAVIGIKDLTFQVNYYHAHPLQISGYPFGEAMFINICEHSQTGFVFVEEEFGQILINCDAESSGQILFERYPQITMLLLSLTIPVFVWIIYKHPSRRQKQEILVEEI